MNVLAQERDRHHIMVEVEIMMTIDAATTMILATTITITTTTGIAATTMGIVTDQITEWSSKLQGRKFLLSLIEGMNLTDHETIYINGAAPPFSTPRAVRFVVLEKDDGLQAVQVPDLAWALCHDYPNWTGPIKVPSLVHMSHKLAELAGNYDDCSDSINNSRFANTMHFL